VSIRKDFVLRALAKDMPFLDLCREYGIARKTGYKWLNRFKEKGIDGLEDEPRRPLRSKLALTAEMALEVVRLREKFPRWGPKKIWKMLLRTYGNETPSKSTVARVLKARGLVRVRRYQKRLGAPTERRPSVTVEKANDLWTADLKGWWRSRDGARCEPLTIRDAHSRYVFTVRLLRRTRTEDVRPVFEEVFRRHGLPKAILTDNGPPFASRVGLCGLTQLSAWWVSLGIEVIRSRPGCPQDNGGHERMHADIAIDVQADAASTVVEQQAAIDAWTHQFNHVRPHEALGLRTPGEVYEPSARKYVTMRVESRAPDMDVREVRRGGNVKYGGRLVYVAVALQHYRVGLRENGGVVRVYFYDKLIGWFRPGLDLTVQPGEPEAPSAAQGASQAVLRASGNNNDGQVGDVGSVADGELVADRAGNAAGGELAADRAGNAAGGELVAHDAGNAAGGELVAHDAENATGGEQGADDAETTGSEDTVRATDGRRGTRKGRPLRRSRSTARAQP
jgi:transposase InsO family protein